MVAGACSGSFAVTPLPPAGGASDGIRATTIAGIGSDLVGTEVVGEHGATAIASGPASASTCSMTRRCNWLMLACCSASSLSSSRGSSAEPSLMTPRPLAGTRERRVTPSAALPGLRPGLRLCRKASCLISFPIQANGCQWQSSSCEPGAVLRDHMCEVACRLGEFRFEREVEALQFLLLDGVAHERL